MILSLLGHAVVLALLILCAASATPPPEPLEKRGIEIAFGPPPAQPQPVLAPQAAVQPAPPTVATVPPDDAVPVLPSSEAAPAPAAELAVSPPHQTVAAEASSPREPVVGPKPNDFLRRPVAPQPPAAAPTPPGPAPAAFAPSPYQTVQPAAASLPGPDPAMSYRAMISAWFESHKRYPDSALQRGEEGSVALRFRVDRFGRVVGYTLLTSTGYADLDRDVDQMMRGARLPPFPAGMTAPQIEVSVRIGFSLVP
jgi:protein TonB